MDLDISALTLISDDPGSDVIVRILQGQLEWARGKALGKRFSLKCLGVCLEVIWGS